MKDIKLIIVLLILLVSSITLPLNESNGGWNSENSEYEVSSTLPFNNNTQNGSSSNFHVLKDSQYDLNAKSPIRIDSNDGLINLSLDKGWHGDGSADDPFIIENYEINGQDLGYAFYIGNVTLHFLIRNCYLHSAEGYARRYFRDSGLYLYNTTNGQIKNNTIAHNRYGIYIQNSWNNTIKNNTISENMGPEMFLLDSDNNTIEKNSIQDKNEPFRNEENQSKNVLVKFRPSKTPDHSEILKDSHLYNELRGLTEYVDASIDRVYPFINGGLLILNEGEDPETAVKILSNHPHVEYAELDRKIQLMKTPNDPGYPSLWGMEAISAPDAWDITTGCDEVVIAVLDTGIDHTHPDLKANLWEDQNGYHGYNFVNDSYYPIDDHGHGTHVAGTIGAVGNNSKGVVGVNWNISLMSLKFIDETGSGTVSDAIASLEYILERKKEGTNIIATSNSWGGTGKSRLLMEAIEHHRDEDILFVAAAGNNNRNLERHPIYPASYELTNVISVGSTDEDDTRSTFSNYGANSVHVAAPGRQINSTDPDEGYRYATGTSMAVPHVSGLAALIASNNESYNHNNIKNIIISSVDRLDDLDGRTLTSGRINAASALTKAPDEDVNLWIHGPGDLSQVEALTVSNVMVSLNDGIYPILGANISVEFSTGEDTIYLQDDGEGWDQVEDDGYYTGSWIPVVHGEVKLTFTARLEDWERQKTVNVTVGKDAGISVWSSNANVIHSNDLTDNPYGVSLFESHNNVLDGNNLSGNMYGVLVERSNRTILTQNSIEDVYEGIVFLESHHNEIHENHISDNLFGINIIEGSNHTLYSNYVFDNYIGIMTTASKNDTFLENNISECIYGIDIYFSNNNTLLGNTGYNNSIFLSLWLSEDDIIDANRGIDNRYNLYMVFSKNITLKNNIFEDSGMMIGGNELEYWDTHHIDMSNTVNGNPIYYWVDREDGTLPSDAGQIILVNSTGVTIKDQNLDRASIGVTLAFSSANTVVNNTVSENFIGIYSYLSDSNEIISNKAFNNEENGIRIFGSDMISLSENTVVNGSYGITILNSERITLKDNHIENTGLSLGGIELKYWNTHSIDTSNKVNGDSIHYWNNEDGGIIPLDAGQVILANCTGVTVRNQELSNMGDAIIIGYSNNITLKDLSISDNILGVYLRESTNNSLKNISSTNNTQGITMLYSNANQIFESNFLNDTYGIILARSKSNEIYLNDFSGTRRAVHIILDSRYNKIYHNNFFESEFDPGRDSGQDNRWYSGYPEGGNYWIIHESEDIYSGPDQNESGRDGIADTPYEGNNFIDKYPLMEPVKPIEIDLLTPENDTYINRDKIIVNWFSSGGIGMIQHRIRVEGEEWIEIGNATDHELTGLKDGVNVVQVEARDNAGRTKNETVVFTVDTNPPIIELKEPEEWTVIYGNEVIVRWEGKSEYSEIAYYEIRIDEGEWIKVEDETKYFFENLRNGINTVEVRAVDRAGNNAVEEVSFHVYSYNLYILVPLLVLTIVLLSYGIWGLTKPIKNNDVKLKVSMKDSDEKHSIDTSEYNLFR